MDVENKSLTMAHYDAKRNKFFDDMIKRNTKIFYDRWQPTTDKDYSWVNRVSIWRPKRSNHLASLKRNINNKSITIHIMSKAARRRILGLSKRKTV
jgi:hypothetical protein